MSTKFTTLNEAGTSDLPLGQLLINANQWISISLLNEMHARGHKNLTPAHFDFLANLDCGATHASAVARRMGLSRQAVYRKTRELQNLYILKLVNDPERKNQKIIQMTERGMAVINDARACLAVIETTLRSRLGKTKFDQLTNILKTDWGPVLE